MTQSEDLRSWEGEKRCLKAVEGLEKNGFTARYCATPDDALQYIVEQAATAATVGFGGSLSIVDLQVIERLRDSEKELLIHNNHALTPEERLTIMRRQLTSDLFLSGTNALTFDGCLVNIDATGNRAASMLFGPKKVIVVAGRNKLVDGTVADAVRRVKMQATPPNARRLNFKTPCAETGFCIDCRSPERLCRVTTIIDRRPRMTDMHVLVVNADLGL